MILLLIPTLFVIAIVSLVLYARWNYGTLESTGIPVVKTHFLLGSTYDQHLVVTGLRDIEWMKKYGSVYGVYEGREPQVHITDAEIIRSVYVKDSDYFNARRKLDFGDPILNEMPDFLPGEKWKIVRQLMSPQLSSGKVKHMSVQMAAASEDYVKFLKGSISKTQNGVLEHYDLKEGLFTMITDLILRCVFSLKVDDISTGNSNNVFVKVLQKLVAGGAGAKQGPFASLVLAFPFLKKLKIGGIFDPQAAQEFVTHFKALMKQRKDTETHLKDFTEYIMELLDRVDSPEFKRANVTELTILCQALVFFFAGQDQISNLVAFLAYYVSRDSEIEKKIRQELDTVLAKRNGVIDHECLPDLVYLNACVTEALRFFPFFVRAERLCIKDWEMEGLKIKKGTVIQIPIWAANRNPKYFENPEEFNPERFMPANKDKLHPYAFSSFGHGPRNCIGIRFSYEVMLITAASLFKNFNVVAEKETKIDFFPGGLFFHPSKPMYFELSERS